MSNRVLEFFIKLTDMTGNAVASITANTKRIIKTAKDAAKSVNKVSQSVGSGYKFIHTDNVLDAIGKGLDKIGVSGKDFEMILGMMERRLDKFNQTGEGFDELISHFKQSMADAGFSTKQISGGLDMLKKNLLNVGESGEQAMEDTRGGMRAVHLAMDALNGNVYSLGRAFTYVLGSIKKLKLSASMLTGISVATYAITEVLTKCVEWWNNKKKKMEEIQNLRFEKTLKEYAAVQSEVNSALAKHERQMDYEIERKKKLIDQNAKLMEQEMELARVKALEGKTGAERDAVNMDYDAQKSALKAKTAIEKAQVELEGSIASAEFIGKLEAKLQPQRDKIAKQLAAMDADVAKREKNARERIGKETVWEGGGHVSTYGMTGTLRHKTAAEIENGYEEWTTSDEEYMKVKEKRDRLKEQYDGIIEDLEEFKQKKVKAIDKANDTKIEIGNIEKDYDIDVWKEYEQDMHDYYEDLQWLEEEAARQAERDAQEKMRLEDQRHKKMVQDAQEELRLLQSEQNEAEGRLSAAKNYAAEAWGFYKDRNSLQQHNADVEEDMADREKFQKEFKSISQSRKYSELKHIARRDGMGAVEEQLAEWRKKKSISLDTEAAMRVGVADDQQRLAQDAAIKTAEATEAALDYLEEISKAVTEEE